jgi:DNA invertase Pin-like site-specific DNA recombinase
MGGLFMATYGYLRVSTEQQNNDKFDDTILRYANERRLGNVEFIEEVISGTKSWKTRKLGSLILEVCKEGDSIIVPELSRLARSIQQIYEIMEICQKRNITLHIIKNGLIINPNEKELTTKLTLGICAVFAEFERDIIVSRTKEALQAKKASGVKLGRPIGAGKSKLDTHAEEIKRFRDIGLSYAKIGKQYGMTAQSVKNWFDKHNI